MHVEVSDPGPGFDKDAARREPSLTGEGGYGLNIIDKVAHRWGVKRNRFARVWFEIDREPRPESHAGARRLREGGAGRSVSRDAARVELSLRVNGLPV